MGYIEDIFGDKGLLASKFAGYESRPGQIEMAKAVDHAIMQRQHLLVEAGCGSGKSVAYGVPAIAHAVSNNLKVVIATENINLQEQLVRKDLPMLQSLLPWKFTYTLLKGRSNYWCSSRIFDAQVDGSVEGLKKNPKYRKQVAGLLAWAKTTKTGDRSDLSPNVDDIVWSAFSNSSDGCKGHDCSFYDSCFYNRAKWAAAEKNIIVTNYHMLFAHLAVKRNTEEDLVLPKFDVLICDEAHAMSSIARDFFGLHLTAGTFKPISRYIKRDLKNEDLQGQLDIAVDELFAFIKELGLDKRRYNVRLRRPLWDEKRSLPVVEALNGVVTRTSLLAERQDASDEQRREAKAMLRHATSARGKLKFCVEMTDNDCAYWIEVDLHGRHPKIALKSAPIFVAKILAQDLFASIQSVIMTSATITTGGNFEFIKNELGAPANIECLSVESPFNFQEQGLLVVPGEADDVRDERKFARIVTNAAKETIEACDGRTMVLFTSNKNMKAVSDLARAEMPSRRIMVQGEDMSKAELQRVFREDQGSVLFGVASFWTGIDIPGESLIGLVIDKIPFPNVSNPLVDAINERLGRRAFMTYSLPKAIITLKQGVGRLIRTKEDYGVVVITDNRVAIHPSYAHAFLSSMPPMGYSQKLSDVKVFIDQKQAERKANKWSDKEELRCTSLPMPSAEISSEMST